MGRYTEYFQEIWKLQANRKVMGINLFGVLVDNSMPFTPGDALVPLAGADQAIQALTQKGYDFIIIAGQPAKRTKLLDINDFENIVGGAREFIMQLGGTVKNIYYAPGTDKNDPYVKPNAGMFERAQAENNFKWADGVYYVGSDVNDVKATLKVKGTPILIKPPKSELKTKAFEITNNVKATEFTSFVDFAMSDLV